MNIQALRTALYEKNKEATLEAFDGCNGYFFDESGMLRWFSPADDGEMVRFDNKVINEHLVEKGHQIKSVNGYIGLEGVEPKGLTFDIMAPISVETLEYVGNKYRAAQYLIDAIEDSFDLILKLVEVEKTSIPYIDDNGKYKQDLKVTVTIGLTDKFLNNNSDHGALISAFASPVKEKLGIVHSTELTQKAA